MKRAHEVELLARREAEDVACATGPGAQWQRMGEDEMRALAEAGPPGQCTTPGVYRCEGARRANSYVRGNETNGGPTMLAT